MPVTLALCHLNAGFHCQKIIGARLQNLPEPLYKVVPVILVNQVNRTKKVGHLLPPAPEEPQDPPRIVDLVSSNVPVPDALVGRTQRQLQTIIHPIGHPIDIKAQSAVKLNPLFASSPRIYAVSPA